MCCVLKSCQQEKKRVLGDVIGLVAREISESNKQRGTSDGEPRMKRLEQEQRTKTSVQETTIEEAKRDLETKLTQLNLTRGKTEAILHGGNCSHIKRHRDALQELGNSAEEAKRQLETKKISTGEELDEITSWGDEVETKMAAADEDIAKLSKCLNDVEQAEIAKTREEQLKFEKELCELKLHYKELEAKQSASKVKIQSNEQCAVAKLPKLTITKFDGTILDWSRF